MTSTKLDLTQEELNILDQMLVQACGYPINNAEEKLGFSKERCVYLFNRTRKAVDSGTYLDLNEQELLDIIRAVAISFIETGPTTELHTVTGYTPEQVEELYNRLSNFLRLKAGK